MPLYKIQDFAPNYREHFSDRDLVKFDVYSGSDKIGPVEDLLVDENGQFRYLVINTGTWIVGKKVLLPIGRSRIDESNHRIYVDGLTREQVKNLPAYTGEQVDYDYEERVRNIYRSIGTTRGAVSAPTAYDRHSYRYDRDATLYDLNDRDHSHWQRSESRLRSGRPLVGHHRRSVGVFSSRQAAEQALHELRDSGFPMDRVSVVVRDGGKHDEMAGANVRDRIGTKADEGATIGAVSGGALGGLTGLLVGLGTLAIPGIGPIMLAGATATALATTLAGGAIGAVSGGLLGALIGLGIPEERARVYQDRVARGGYLVIVDGTDSDIRRAEAILHRRGIEEYGVYDAPNVSSADSTGVHGTHSSTIGRRSAVGFFSNLADAEQAVADLRNAGFPLSQVTLVAHNLQRRNHLADIDLRDRFESTHWGIPTEHARSYHDRLDRGEYMVIVQGTEEEISRAASVLNRRGIRDWRMYDPTAIRSEQAVSSSSTTVTPSTTRATPTGMTTAASTSGVTSTTTNRMGMHQKRAIGVFSRREDAETALTELRNAGFPMDRVSLIAKHAGEHDRIAGVDMHSQTGNKADEGAKTGAIAGGALGGLGGLLVGLGTLAIPGIGPVVLGGAAATALATTLTGGAIGAVAGGLTGALVGLGVPEDRARVYNDRVARGDYLVMIDGTESETHQAETILRHYNIHEWGIYDAADIDATRHPQEMTQRRTSPDVDPLDRDRDPRIDNSRPNITIIDRRDETRR